MHDGAPVGVQHDGRVAILDRAITHPSTRSAWRRWPTLEQALAAQAADPATRVIIITGAGDKTFAAAPISANWRRRRQPIMASPSLPGARCCATLWRNAQAGHRGYERRGVRRRIWSWRSACHLRVCSDQARMGQTEINLGFDARLGWYATAGPTDRSSASPGVDSHR